MGKLIRLKGVTFPGAPKLKQFDEIETFGSLFLLDVGSVVDLPNGGQSSPNVLRTLTSQLTSQTTNLDFTVKTKIANNANWRLERTGKKGIHGIIKQNTGNTQEISFVFSAPLAVRNWVLANPNRSYYVSIWTTVTKTAISNPAVQSPMHFCTNVGGGTNGLFNSGGGRFNDAGGNRLDNLLVPNIDDTVGPAPLTRFNAARYSGIVNNGQTLDTSNQIEIGVGAFGPWGYFNHEKGASRILYRAYMEDLTASGRSFAEVSALDKALYDEAFGVGGRFANDTYTDPNTI